MTPIDEDLRRQINQLVDQYRDRCLWFLRADYYPTDLPEVLRTLDDWIDMITCHERIQPLGYLAWAACGKDPGFSPLTILEQAGRSGHYTTAELEGLSFDGPPPDLADLLRRWHSMVREAREVVAVLPAEHVGTCVLHRQGDLYREDLAQLRRDLAADDLLFHLGRIRGAYPQISQQ